MLYCSVDDFEIEFTQEELARLTGDSTGAVVDTNKIDLAIERASAIIDAYLSKRITTALDIQQNKLLKHICIALAINDLYEIKYKFSAIPESVLGRKRNAFTLLKMLKSGDISLNNAIHGESASPFLFTNKSQSDTKFTDALLNEFSGENYV